ncbi:MAG: hypothetical protein LCH99_37200 [Proteobacteria bacterium]|nr:hypothetical protein [Pseudomonadota bacterium]
MSAIAFSRAIGPVAIDCVVSEQHQSGLEITEIPIESGARITDHAFVLPKRVTLEIANDNAVATYNALVAFQASRVPFTLVTGLAVYNNMLISMLDPGRDKEFSRVLRTTIELQEIIIVGTAYADDGSGRMAGEPGGRDSTRSSLLAKERARDAATADRVGGTVQRGDTGVLPAPDLGILNQIFGG